jgi:phosphatidylinositol alpha-1,6-mannosyltransferase
MRESTSIVLVTRNLPPLRGGMERLLQHMANGLATRYPLAVVGPDGSRVGLDARITLREAQVRPLWRFLVGSFWHTCVLSLALRPRVVIAGSGLTAPMAVIGAMLGGSKALVYLHGLDIVAKHPLYRRVWLPFIRRCALVVVNSNNTRQLALAAGLDTSRITVIPPGVTLPDLSGALSARHAFRTRYGLDAKKIMLAVGRLTPRKGLREFVDQVLPGIVAHCPQSMVVVIGDDAQDALVGQGKSSRADVLAAAARHGIEQHLLFLGPRDDAELSAAYFAADLCIFPIVATPGDVEGFGMVAVEAAAHGLETVAYDVGGVADAVSHGVSGRLVPAGDAQAFIATAVDMLAREYVVCARCVTFAAGFQWHAFNERMADVIDGVPAADTCAP